MNKIVYISEWQESSHQLSFGFELGLDLKFDSTVHPSGCCYWIYLVIGLPVQLQTHAQDIPLLAWRGVIDLILTNDMTEIIYISGSNSHCMN